MRNKIKIGKNNTNNKGDDGTMELSNEDKKWLVVDVNCENCLISYPESVDLDKIDRLVKSQGATSCEYFLECCVCQQRIKIYIERPEWAMAAEEWDKNPWWKKTVLAKGVVIGLSLAITGVLGWKSKNR